MLVTVRRSELVRIYTINNLIKNVVLLYTFTTYLALLNNATANPHPLFFVFLFFYYFEMKINTAFNVIQLYFAADGAGDNTLAYKSKMNKTFNVL